MTEPTDRLRPSVQQLLTDLSSTDEAVLQDALERAREFLKETTVKYWWPHQRPSAQQGDVPEQYRIVELTPTEFNAVVNRLIELLDGPLDHGYYAAFCLMKSFEPRAIPPLARLLRRSARKSGFGALQAVFAISDIYYGAAFSDAWTGPSLAYYLIGQRALRYAARRGRLDHSDLRGQARQAMRTLDQRARALRKPSSNRAHHVSSPTDPGIC